MKIYNTLSRKIEEFKPLNPPIVTFYSCGPTVYDYTHIGHIRTFIGNDILKKTLTYLGYKVKHVMNITDVGHLSGDDDTGVDKMEKGAKKYKKTVWEVADFYTDFFLKTIDEVNVQRPTILCKATDHIQDMLQFNIKLEQKGFTYQTSEAVYFDTSKFLNYGRLSGQKLEEKIQKSREEVYIDPGKKHPADFALWLKCVGRFKNHVMHWSSPWGEGFPGWHIECSAMSMRYLGESLDIHSGGVDHIAIHHENEMAQSEGASGKKFVNYWVHFEFLNVEGKKMSKSLGNFYTIDDIKKKNIDPLAIRYLFLQTHYRQPMNFTWESAKAAQEGLNKLKNIIKDLKNTNSNSTTPHTPHPKPYAEKFKEFISNDFQIPQAVALMWDMLKSNLNPQEKLQLIFDFDKVFGLKLSETKEEKIPAEIIILAKERLTAKKNKDFKKADEIRQKILKQNYSIEDTKEGYKLSKNS